MSLNKMLPRGPETEKNWRERSYRGAVSAAPSDSPWGPQSRFRGSKRCRKLHRVVAERRGRTAEGRWRRTEQEEKAGFGVADGTR